MVWIGMYLLMGVVVFLLLAYAIDSEPAPAGWWRDWSFLLVMGLCVVGWPMVLGLWVRKQWR